jgi:hypothetical protein
MKEILDSKLRAGSQHETYSKPEYELHTLI